MAPDIEGIGLTSKRVRLKMVERLRTQGITDERVLSVMAQIPRHIFVQEAFASRAYDDTALPLGLGQTISQPFVVARMTSLLLEGRQSLGKVLEIGTGCGYQAAVLAPLSEVVYSVERISEMLQLAREHLFWLKEPRVRLKHADGTMGMAEVAPFDSILVAAATPEIPQALLKQLAPSGRLIIPMLMGDDGTQYLKRVDYTSKGFEEQLLEEVRFVPLLSGLQ